MNRPFDCGPNPCEWPCTENCFNTDSDLCPYPAESSLYYITVPTLTNNNCGNCSEWSGDFMLKRTGRDIWDSPASILANCGKAVNDPHWRLVYESGYAKLKALGLGVEYRLADTSWVCHYPNTLSIVTPTPAGCTGFPSTIKVMPCLVTCLRCSESVTPRTISITLANTTNGTCTCTSLNATYVLAQSSIYFGTTNGHFPCSWYGTWAFTCSSGAAGTIEIAAWINPANVIVDVKVLVGANWVMYRAAGTHTGTLDCGDTISMGTAYINSSSGTPGALLCGVPVAMTVQWQ